MKYCDINADGVKKYDKTFGTGVKAEPQKYMHEHDKVYSRTLNTDIEICMGPHGAAPDKGSGGLVPANPFASIAQQRYLHAHPEKVGGKTALDEWDAATDFKKLPKRAKKK